MKKQGFEPNTRFLIVVSKFLHGATNASIAITSKSVKAMSMTKKKRTTFCLMVLGSLSAKDPNSIKHARGPLNKGVGLPISTLSNINNISMWIRADGWSARNPSTGGSGGIFPRGIPVGVIFADGLVWSGLIQDGQEPILRVGGQTYFIGTVPGRIISRGIAEDPDAADVRIWRVRRDYPTADLRQDAADLLDILPEDVTEAQIDQVRAQYETDWMEWPAEKGAPFYDAGGDGIYAPQFDGQGSPILFPDADEPGIVGADQVVWFVANDLNEGAVMGLYGSPPIGLEMQVTLWAYDMEHALNTAIFKRYKLIYKGTSATPDGATIDSMYIAQWSDPDLGSFGDDFVGVDTLLSLGYAYNSSPVDNAFEEFGLPPPAVGYVLLQGPIVESPGDTATFDFSRLPGYKNLPLTSFSSFVTGSAILDPPLGVYEGTVQWRNLHQGLIPATGEPFIDPTTGLPELFTRYGDPVTGTGWLDANPGDRRMVMNTGPFDMALGDTQEVVLALVAGMGSDHISSVIELRNNVYLPHALQANLFAPAPQVDASVNYISTTQTDVVITIDSPEEITATEALIYDYPETFITSVTLFDDGAHNDGDAGDGVWGNTWTTTPRASGVYMNIEVTTADGTLSWSRMANRVSTLGPVLVSELLIEDDSINEDGIINNGEKITYSLSIHNGSASNIQDLLVFFGTADTLITAVGSKRGNALANIPANSTVPLDSDLNRFFVISEEAGGALITFPVDIFDRMYNRWRGEVQISVTQLPFNVEIGLAEHIAGKADGIVGYRVADVSALTADEYEITFNWLDSEVSFNLENNSTNSTLLDSHAMPEDVYSNDIPITEGFKVVLVGPPLEAKSWSYEPGTGLGERWFSGAGGGGEILFGAVFLDITFWRASLTDPADYKTVEIRWGGMSGFTDENGNGEYDGGEPYTVDAAKPNQNAFLYFTWGAGQFEGFLPVPFEAWDVEDPDNPRQLDVFVRDFSARDLGGIYPTGVGQWDYSFVGGGEPFEYIWIMATDYDPTGSRYDPNAGGIDLMDQLSGSGPGAINAYFTLWFGPRGSRAFLADDGVLTLVPNHIFSTADVYRFRAFPISVEGETGIPKSYELAQNYPNPFNPATVIQFTLSRSSFVRLRLYNILGQEVTTLQDGSLEAGTHELIWDGTNSRGDQVASGIYFYKLDVSEKAGTTPIFSRAKKMVLLR